MPAFTAAERNLLAERVQAGDELVCPACGGELTRREVEPSEQVSYVRRRVWLLCTVCKRMGAVDVREVRGGGRP